MPVPSQKRRKFWRAAWSNKTTLIGIILTSFILLVALLAPWVAPFDAIEQDFSRIDLAPGPIHILGTDNYGRDVLSRIIMGARVSLAIALSAVGIALTVGGLVGIIAGYKGGTVDAVTVRIIDMLMTFPTTI
ncbi:MAG: ABC transporter permease, partial [Candidatus Binatia bacterium]